MKIVWLLDSRMSNPHLCIIPPDAWCVNTNLLYF